MFSRILSIYYFFAFPLAILSSWSASIFFRLTRHMRVPFPVWYDRIEYAIIWTNEHTTAPNSRLAEDEIWPFC